MATAAVRIYEALAGQIINGEMPPGHRLEEQGLAERYGVSRTPVREVLRDLAARGLVEFVPRRGAVVAQIGLGEMTDMLEAECELEALCAKLAAHKMSALEKVRLQDVHERAQALVRRADRAGYFELNTIFHAAICAGVQNRTLNLAISQLRDRLAPLRQMQRASVSERLQRSIAEHEGIVAAIMKGDADAAYAAMRLHNARLGAGALAALSEPALPSRARAGRKTGLARRVPPLKTAS